MMKTIALLLLAVTTVLGAPATTTAAVAPQAQYSHGHHRYGHHPAPPTFTLLRPALTTANVPFQSHSGTQPFQSYLVQTIDFQFVKPLYDQIQQTLPYPIQTRGEAHITVVTPPEFDKVLSPVGITMADIDRIALKHRIQNTKMTPKCIGSARTRLDGHPNLDEVYFVVMDAPHLLPIRKDIQKLFLSKGGSGALFEAEAFWPHVTVGFTYRDMFIEDGVFKGMNSCIAKVTVVDPPTPDDDGGDDGGDNGGDDGGDDGDDGDDYTS